MKTINYGQNIFVNKRIISTVRKVKFVTCRTYTVLRGRWCNIILLNAHAPLEYKSDDSKDISHEEFRDLGSCSSES
jgi:hypothetical protein